MILTSPEQSEKRSYHHTNYHRIRVLAFLSTGATLDRLRKWKIKSSLHEQRSNSTNSILFPSYFFAFGWCLGIRTFWKKVFAKDLRSFAHWQWRISSISLGDSNWRWMAEKRDDWHAAVDSATIAYANNEDQEKAYARFAKMPSFFGNFLWKNTD